MAFLRKLFGHRQKYEPVPQEELELVEPIRTEQISNPPEPIRVEPIPPDPDPVRVEEPLIDLDTELPVRVLCGKRTKKGTPCKKRVIEGRNACEHHCIATDSDQKCPVHDCQKIVSKGGYCISHIPKKPPLPKQRPVNRPTPAPQPVNRPTPAPQPVNRPTPAPWPTYVYRPSYSYRPDSPPRRYQSTSSYLPNPYDMSNLMVMAYWMSQ